MSELSPTEVAAPTPLKLRGSCESCSVSKVRCDKAKPICSRCARRKIGCEYVATKRVGRKQSSTKKASIASPSSGKHISVDMSQSLTAMMQSPSQVLPPADMGMTLLGGDMDVDMFMPSADSFDYSVFASMTSTNTNTNTSSSVQTPSPQPSGSTATTSSLPAWDLFSDFFPVDPMLAADLDSNAAQQVNSGTVIYEDFDDLFATPSIDDNPKTNADNHAPPGTITLFPEHGFTGLDEATFMDQLMTRPDQHTLDGTQVPPAPPQDSLQQQAVPEAAAAQQPPTPPSCGPCIIEALALMRQLFPHNPSKSCSSHSDAAAASAPADGPFSPPQPTFEAITSQNEAVTDACIAMLRCACSEDGYLLAVVSLIVFKVLAWYAAAVHSSRLSETVADARSAVGVVVGGAVVEDGYSDEFDATRVAAQLVLGKMHRVQHLVNQLSGKLKARRLEGNATRGSAGQQELGGGGLNRLSSVGSLQVSGVMLEQLEVDLRKRLRALSLEITGVLKRE